MIFVKIKKPYIDYLRSIESRIPKQDYGINSYKPFYIINLSDKSEVLYISQLTSIKDRHNKMKDTIDFKKLFDARNGKTLGATNLNYMFPILEDYLERMNYKDILLIIKDKLKTKTLFIEKRIIENMNIDNDARKVYVNKYKCPKSSLSLRCIDFKFLEGKMIEFKLCEQFQKDIKVERSKDYSTFFISTGNNRYKYSENILNDIYGFVNNFNDKMIEEELNNSIDCKKENVREM
ncbi:MAG: type III toxin-antitoxin system ToxN/AbiQ family toxin [Erysipelotrichaceae bacterium]